MIASDILVRLPDQARAKLLLLDGLAADADDMARAAQGRLNNLGRQYPGAGDGNPNTVRLAAVVQTQAHRHRELFDLIGSCQRWLRGLPPDAPLDVVAVEPPGLREGEQTIADAVVSVRSEIGELVVERLRVTQAPEPKADIKRAMRLQVARMAELGRPTLPASAAGPKRCSTISAPTSASPRHGPPASSAGSSLTR